MQRTNGQLGQRDERSARTQSLRIAAGPRCCRRGYTLIELIVSMTVGVIISGIAGLMLLNASRVRAETAARCDLADTTGAAVETIIRYVREIPQDECAGSDPPCLNGNAQIDEASSSTLRYDTYGFRLNGTTVEMTDDSGTNWHPLLRNTVGFQFSYYDRINKGLTAFPLSSSDRAAVRRITVSVKTAQGSEAITLRTSIYLRSFMNEVASDP